MLVKMAGKESDEQQRQRFQIELEFVQCLANPNYLNYLAQRGFLKDKAFINYLSYLKYWKKPEYAKYLKYPMCLHFLDLLQYEHFRKEITNGQCAKFIEDQQLLHWQHYIRKRTRLLQAASGTDTPTAMVAQKAAGIPGIAPMTGSQSNQNTSQTTGTSLPSGMSTLSNGNTFATSTQSSSNQILTPK